jgi:cytochrome c oxidase subunit 2
VGGAASAGSGGLLPPAPESPGADAMRTVYVVVLVVAAVALVLVEGALVAVVLRRRRARTDGGEAPTPEGGGQTQLVWAVVPIVALSALASFALYKVPDIVDAPAAGAAGETRIVVEAHQFYWLFRYPNGASSVNEMIAPADTVVHLEVTAPEDDVVHSWWAPQLGPKVDATPGRTNETWFEAPEGTYVVRCAKLCGLQHAVMQGTVRVVSRVDYSNFLTQGVSPETLGEQEFVGVCMACHRLDEPFIGPALGSSAALSNREQLESIVREGIRTMPAVGNTWTHDQIEALYAYTQGLSGGE